MTRNRRECTLRTPCQPRSVGEALHCLARHSDLDARRLADLSGVRYADFIRWTDGSDPCKAPTWLLPTLTTLTGRQVAIEKFAHDCGGVFTPLATVDPEHVDLLNAHLTTMRESGEAAQALLDGARDGRWTDDECSRFGREAKQVIAAWVALEALVRSKVAESNVVAHERRRA